MTYDLKLRFDQTEICEMKKFTINLISENGRLPPHFVGFPCPDHPYLSGNITQYYPLLASYLSIFLQKHIFKILKIYPQKARKSQYF